MTSQEEMYGWIIFMIFIYLVGFVIGCITIGVTWWLVS